MDGPAAAVAGAVVAAAVAAAVAAVAAVAAANHWMAAAEFLYFENPVFS